MPILLSFLLVLLGPACARGETPKRIVSLLPSNTEILFDLGAGASVAGVSNYCDYPEEAKRIEKVGDYIHPNFEKIVELKPDLVLAGLWKSTHIVPRLKAAGLRVVEVDLPASLEDIYTSILKIARTVDREPEGARLVKDLQGRVEKITREARKRKRAFRAYIEIDPPNWTLSKLSFINDAVERCGAVNIFRDLPASGVQVSWEAVVKENPGVILLFGTRKREVVRRPGWSGISAVKDGRIIDDLGKNILNRPTPRIVLGMEQLHERFLTFENR